MSAKIQFLNTLSLINDPLIWVTLITVCHKLCNKVLLQIRIHYKSVYITNPHTLQIRIHYKSVYITQIRIHYKSVYITNPHTFSNPLVQYFKSAYITNPYTFVSSVYITNPYTLSVYITNPDTLQIRIHYKSVYITNPHTWQIRIHYKSVYIAKEYIILGGSPSRIRWSSFIVKFISIEWQHDLLIEYGPICHIVKWRISMIRPFSLVNNSHITLYPQLETIWKVSKSLRKYWGKYGQTSFYIISCITCDCIIDIHIN